MGRQNISRTPLQLAFQEESKFPGNNMGQLRGSGSSLNSQKFENTPAVQLGV